MLALSLFCNVSVLFVPFIRLRAGLAAEDYALMRSVEMLWHGGLWVLAVLVFVFSLVLPFAK